MAKDYPMCWHPKRDCKALDDFSRCRALTDTAFHSTVCPFYKSRYFGRKDLKTNEEQ